MPHIMPTKSKTLPVTLAAAALFLSSSASFALDVNAVAERYKEFTASGGMNLSYESIENQTDDSFTMKGISFGTPGVEPATVTNIDFSGVVENSDGSVSISKMTSGKFTFAQKDFSFTIDQMAVDNFVLPSKSETDALKSMFYYTGLSASNFMVIVEGNTVATVAALKANTDLPTRESPMVSQAEITGIAVDFTSIKDVKFKQGLTQLGYGEKFTGKIAMDSKWNAADGRLELEKFDFEADNIGTLGLSFIFNGMTAELIKRLQDASKAASETKDPQASSMAMMQELPNVFLESATINFKDDSITKRILKFQSSIMGGSPDDVAKMVPVMIPMALAGLGNPNFTNMVAGAVGRFVGEPGNIKISAAPAKPVAFSEIMGIGMAAPQTLPDALGVKVTANE